MDWYIGGVVIYCLFIPYSFCTVGFVTIHFHIKLCWMLVCFINIHFIFHICWCLQSWYTIQVIKPLLRTRELRKRMFNTVILPISDQELNPHSQARHCSIQTFKVGHWSGSKVFFFFFWGTAGQKKKNLEEQLAKSFGYEHGQVIHEFMYEEFKNSKTVVGHSTKLIYWVVCRASKEEAFWSSWICCQRTNCCR